MKGQDVEGNPDGEESMDPQGAEAAKVLDPESSQMFALRSGPGRLSQVRYLPLLFPVAGAQGGDPWRSEGVVVRSAQEVPR